MRVVVLGNSPWSVPSLAALHRSAHAVVAAITEPPKPAGRGRGLRSTAVADAARDLGVPLIEHGDGPLAPVVADLAPDALAVIAYGRLLPPSVLDLAPVAPLNLHFSLLPDLRGASPVQSAILRGDRVTGVSVMRMVAALDAGPVYARREATIGDDEDAGSLGARLADLGADLLVEVLDALAAGTAVATPQDATRVTTCGKLGAADRSLRWDTEDAARTVARVRALAPEPGATTTFRGHAVRVATARVADADASDAPPGAIVAVEGDGVLVATTRGTVRILEVVPAGRRAMTAAAYVRGARPAPGERFV